MNMVFYAVPPGPPRSKESSTDASLEREARKPVPVPRTAAGERSRRWYVILAVIGVAIALLVYLVVAR